MKRIKSTVKRILTNRDQDLQALSSKLTQTSEKVNSLSQLLDGHLKDLKEVRESIKVIHDNNTSKTRQLWELRNTKDYLNVYNEDNPLVSVRIASYNKTHELINKAIQSVLSQTYSNIEIIVVNDGPNPKTREAIENLKDKRIRYFELPYRSIYPDDDLKRWQVAGSPGMNYGAFHAKGQWIAPLDDDDCFTPDHIEKLLSYALKNRCELVMGGFEHLIIEDGKETLRTVTPSIPPKNGHSSMQSSIYLKKLDSIFSYSKYSYLFNEPGDWNLISGMIECGVKIGAIKDIVVKVEHISDLSTRA